MKRIIFPIIGVVLLILGILLMVDFLKLFLKSFIGLVLVIIGINLIFYRSAKTSSYINVRKTG